MNSFPVGLIGLGLVGKALARRWIPAGYPVIGRDPDSSAARGGHEIGVELTNDLRSVAAKCRIVVLSLPNSAIVADVLWGADGLAQCCDAGHLILDTTTSDPTETIRNAERLAERQIRFVDCPLVGSSREISDGAGVALVGDEEPEAAPYAPLLHLFAKQVFYLGKVGRAHTAKLVVNLALGLHRIVLSEALGLAVRNGLDLPQVLEILSGSAAYSEVMRTQGDVMIQGDFTRPAARLAQHAKDVKLILRLAEASGARMPLSAVHDALLDEAIAAGWGVLDNSAVVNLFIPPRS
jgi:3-hydroxyisobutyrate dehydrogenase-like beta-hydroxyacid dehydrogenase